MTYDTNVFDYGMPRRGADPYVAAMTAMAPSPLVVQPPAPAPDPFAAASTTPGAPPPADPFAAARTNYPIAPEAAANAIQDTTSESGRAITAGFENFGAAIPALYGAGANLVSPHAGDAALETAAGMMRRAQENGPAIQSWDQVHGVGDFAALARNTALMSAPDIALMLAGGGIGGAAVKGVARRAAMDAAETYAARQVAKTGIGELSADVVKKQGVDAATRVATAQAVEAKTAEVAPRFLKAAADNTSKGAVKAGTIAGTTAGMYPGTVAGSVSGAPDAEGNMVGGLEGQDQAGTAKILLGDLGAALAGSFPEVRLLGRIGGDAAAKTITETAARYLPRVAKEAAIQGTLGGAAGIAMTATQFATHKWVNDNVDLMSPAAYSAYINSAIGGATMGVGLGGAVEGVRALGGVKAAVDPNAPTPEPTDSAMRRGLAGYAQMRDAAYAKAKGSIGAFFTRKGPAPGEEMGPGGPDVPTDGTGVPPPPPGAGGIGETLGAGIAGAQKTAGTLFDNIYSKLTNPDAQTAVKNSFANALGTAKDHFTAVLHGYKQALDDTAGNPKATADIMKAHAEALDEHANATPDVGAATDFSAHLHDLEPAQENPDDFSTRFEQGLPGGNPVAPAPRAPNTNPYRLNSHPGEKSSLQDLLATFIPIRGEGTQGVSLWGSPAHMKVWMASAEKMVLGAPVDHADFVHMNELEQWAPDAVKHWEAAAPEMQARRKGVNASTDAADTAQPDNTAMSDAMQTAQEAHLKAATEASLPDQPNTAVTAAKPESDFVPGIKAPSQADTTAEHAGEYIPGMSDRSTLELKTALREQLVAAQGGAKVTMPDGTSRQPTPDEISTLQSKYRNELLGGASTFEENPGLTPKPGETPAEHKARSTQLRADFAAKTKDPTYVETTPKVVGSRGDTRRVLIHLDNMLQRHRAQRSPLTGKQMSPHDAMLGAIADLHLAGVEVKPGSIHAGSLGEKNGESLGRITPNDAAHLNGEISKRLAAAKAAKPATTTPDQRAALKGTADAAKTAAFARFSAARDALDKARTRTPDPNATPYDAVTSRLAEVGRLKVEYNAAKADVRAAGMTPKDVAEATKSAAFARVDGTREALQKAKANSWNLKEAQTTLKNVAAETKGMPQEEAALHKLSAERGVERAQRTTDQVKRLAAEHEVAKAAADKVGLTPEEIDKRTLAKERILAEPQANKELKQGEDTLNADPRDEGRKLITRGAPPVDETGTTSGRGVFSAEASRPYGKLISGIVKAREQLQAVKGTHDVQKIQTAREALHKTAYEAGKVIGAAELKKKLDAGSQVMNKRRYGLEMQRLDHPDGKLAYEYARKAEHNKLDEGKTRLQRGDEETPARVQEYSREGKGTIVKDAKGEPTGLKVGGADAYYREIMKARGEPQPTSVTAQHIRDLLLGKQFEGQGQREGGLVNKKVLTSDEAKFVARLRDSVQDTPEFNATRKALEKYDEALAKASPSGGPEARAKAKAELEAKALKKDSDKAKLADAANKAAAEKAAADKATAKKAAAEKAASEGQRTKQALEKLKEAPGYVAMEDKEIPTGNKNEKLKADITAGLEKLATNEGVHDHVAETRMVNAIFKRAGIKDLVKVVPWLKATTTHGADYSLGTRIIRLNPNLRGGERVEVLSHEIGHHIIRSELARAMGVPIESIAHNTTEEVFGTHDPVSGKLKGGLLAKHLPELHKAISKDYSAWYRAHNDPSMTTLDVTTSRKAELRSEAMRSRALDTGLTLRDQTPEDRAYMHSPEEYVADQLSRAFTGEATPENKVTTFFKGIADKLKIAYDSLFSGAKSAKYAPAPSVDAWVRSMFDRTTLDVSEALHETVPAKQAQTGVEASVHAKMAEAAAANTPPPSPPGSKGAGAPPPLPPTGLKALVQFFRDRLNSDQRNIIERTVNTGRVIKALANIYKDRPGALNAMRDARHGMEARFAYAYMADQAGLLNTGPKSRSVLNSLKEDLHSIFNVAGDSTYARRIFDDIANGRIESMRAANKPYDVRAREAQYRGVAQQGVDVAKKMYAQAQAPFERVFTGSMKRLRLTGVPALQQLNAALQLHTGERSKDRGLITAQTHNTDIFMRRAANVFTSLSEREQMHVITALQRREDVTGFGSKLDGAVAAWRTVSGQMYDYAQEAGNTFPRMDKHFQVVMDITKPGDKAKLVSLLSNPIYEKDIREAMGTKKKPAKGDIADLVARMADSAERRSPGNDTVINKGSDIPGFSGGKTRLMQFIYDHNIPEDVKTFASLQNKDLSTLLSQYIGPLVKTTESVRRFGKNDVGLKALLAKATAQGATPAQIQQANAAVNGARGMVGIDGSPVLRTLLGATLEKKITGNPVTRKVLSYTAAYENARLLPLMLLSSVVDPTGIAVRTGGDFKTAWDGFKVGMKSIYDKQTKEEIHGMLQTLGQVDDFRANEILTNKFGGGSEGGGRQINDIIFKVNGMSLLTRVTRYMALVSAHGFLVKHGAGASELSARYIGELSLRPGDAKSAGNNRVQILSDAERAATTPAERARDDRVRQALMQFVDEAILRPTSQQAPNWFADPYMGLVTQYKTFGYAIYDQIGGRIMHELKHGNPSVLLPAMAYLPISIAAEMMRGVIQYGPGGNPHRKDWGPGQYASLGLLQAGYLGPIASYQSSVEQDMQRGRLAGTSLLGPAAQQAGQVISTLSGQRSIGATVKSAAPFESLWKNWGGGASTATPSNRGMERRHTA